MSVFIEPLILYAVLFFRFSTGMVQSAQPVEFQALAEINKLVFYTLPSLALVWYLVLKVKSLKKWGVSLLKKKDLVIAGFSFPALVLIGLTISLVSPYFNGIPAGRRILPPENIISWAIMALSCISSAYLEESYFRFYLLSKREEMGLGPYRAILLSTILFSFCHLYEGPWGFLNAALSGVLLAFVYVRFKSLHGVAIAHAMYNILVYVLGAAPK